MKILVLDTIHGGDLIAKELIARGNLVDSIDVYRGDPDEAKAAESKSYDLVVAPVHLDPEYPLLKKAKVITHHEAVRSFITPPKISIEVTGAKGKTTTAFALAHLLEGTGILHTSSGTYLYPEKKKLWRKSITPASVISVALEAEKRKVTWLITEESLGVSGFGKLGILTSSFDYKIASGKKSALLEKQKSLQRCGMVLVTEGAALNENWFSVNNLVSMDGETLTSKNGSFTNPLLKVSGYSKALKTAAAAGVLLGVSIEKLSTFEALPGRLHLSLEGKIPVMDNSASGTNAENTTLASKLLKKAYPNKPVTLVIGMEEHAVCEGFPADEIIKTVKAVNPKHLILITGEDQLYRDYPADLISETFAEAKEKAFSLAEKSGGSILFAVKTWR